MNQFDKRHLANVRKYQRQIDKIYRDAAAQVAARYLVCPCLTMRYSALMITLPYKRRLMR